ncbi:xanthine dehydrogenase family protein molybdopterin-binding subunit [Pseudomonas sp. GL-B-19]|uniref:xanthine dehydrogenase family protein molybdopterin-binding subunit n=1 Tax=Pseudomonas sp. GL-B-19 TaxID=2832393 RepID=UPI001CBBC0C3|nr:xanthine dehydrogenase family protein molybdopterin-binding subunit [Pseudomonas sp. GL-B-19]
MNSIHPLSRRSFLKGSALLGSGLVVAFVIPGAHRFALGAENQGNIFAPNAFLRIGNDNSVTVLLGHSEMGQGIWTGLTMLIAEELDADWSKIRVEHSPASAAEYGMPGFGGMQITGGSTSTWMEFDRYRQAGAAARLMLIEAAAKRFDVAPSQIRTESGVVIAGDQRATYGELADDAGQLPVPDPASIKFKEAKDWKIIGKPTKRLDTPEKITGQAKFGMDVQFDGLMTAMVARPPVFGGSVKSFEGAEALAVPGVHKVVQVPTGVAVIADHFWAAKLGRDALKVDWDLGPNTGLDSQKLLESFRKLAATPGISASKAGDATAAMSKAAKKLDVEYSVPYLAHAPMEPLNCTVKISKDKCEIWTGTQFQTLDQMIAGKITGLKPEQVEIHTEFLGGGFGRRANPTSDFVAEAVQVAKAAGAPVKTVWSREDDIRGGYYRSMFLHQANIGLDADGLPVAWKHVLVGQSIMADTMLEASMVKGGVDKTSVEGVADSPYIEDLANHQVELHSPKTGIAVLWLRSVGHTHTAFVMESLIDEMAEAAGKDPVEYRRILLKNHPRHLGVLNLAVEKANWGAPLPDGHALGVAVHESFGSFVAQVAEVSQDNLKIRVHRVVCAVDCGIAVNPQSIAAQMESCITFGLSFALHSKLTLRGGQVVQSNFHDYKVLRLNEMPVVEVHILPSSDKPGGIGETGVPPTAPAVANAVFALTGQRLRELPLQLSGV